MKSTTLALITSLALSLSASAKPTKPDNFLELTPSNHVQLVGEVNSESIQKVFEAIYEADSNKPLTLYIDSPGGSVFDGMRLVHYFRTTKREINCVVGSMAASMAFILLESCPGSRLVTSDTVLMGHNIQSSGGQGSVDNQKSQLDFITKLNKLINIEIAKRLGISYEEYNLKVLVEYWLVGTEEILKSKAADGTVTLACSVELEKIKKCPF